jgi:hypothetical protein
VTLWWGEGARCIIHGVRPRGEQRYETRGSSLMHGATGGGQSVGFEGRWDMETRSSWRCCFVRASILRNQATG